MRIDVLTLFPEMFAGVLDSSILKRAAEPVRLPGTGAGTDQVRPPAVSYHLHDIRAYTTDKHGKVDQPPFGGGPGMVMQCGPVWDAVRAVEAMDPAPATRVLLTPQGQPLTQPLVEELASKPRLLLIAGHYEGIDERVIERLRDEGGLREVSIGDYVLTGGELPAMVLIDAVVRLQPGVLGDEESAHADSFSPGAERLLDHPHYTRPREWEGRAVPEVLLSGDHAKIAAWRREEALRRTRERRPDLLGAAGGTGTAEKSPLVVLRRERPGEAAAIAAVHRAAFPSDLEARLVDRLREADDLLASLVAAVSRAGEERVVGHAALSPVTIADQPSLRGLLGLGPVAVDPAWRGRGIGSALVEQAVAEAREDLRARAVFVLGDPGFYGRMGFQPAAEIGFTSDYGSGPQWMVRLLRGPLPEGWTGRVRYADAFRDAGG